ncbi:MAG: tetratricopeptide repeat protein [Syntrophorhabdales bacterium]
MRILRQRSSWAMAGRAILVFSIMVSAAVLSPVRAAAQADKIYAENSKAVVVVVAANEETRSISQGSGFIVREDGAVVTNYHVINTASKIRVKAGERIFDVEGLLYADAENDVAILKIDGKNLPTVKLGDLEKAQVGEKVFVISSPQGFENTISEGILSGIRRVDETRKVLQITAAISPGSSGAPVFNSKGEAIGIATFLVAEAQNINFAMPISLIKNRLHATTVVTAGEACSADFTKTAECWFYQGVAYGSNGMYERSVEAFGKAIQIKKDFSEAYFNLGVSYIGLGKYKEAREALEKVIQMKPDSADAYENLGAVFSKLGMYDDAIRTLKKAIAINAESAHAYYNLGVNYVNMENYRAALEAFKQAIRFQPDFAAAHGYLGVTYAKMKDYKMAADALKQSIRLKPDDPRSHYALGETYLALKDRPSALDEYKMLKQLDADLADKLFKQIYR